MDSANQQTPPPPPPPTQTKTSHHQPPTAQQQSPTPRSMLISDSTKPPPPNNSGSHGGALQRPATAAPAVAGGVGADENRFFYEDEVFGWDPHERIRFGLVMETYDANYSDSEQSDAEEPALRQGEVRVAWHPRGVEEVLGETDLGLADRTLMPGDVVRRIVPGQKTQKGYCREVRVSADVSVKGTACMLRNVRADRMRPLITTMRDNAVCLDSWVGSSKLVNLKLVLRTPCGSVLELRPESEYTRLCDQDSLNRKGFFANTAFYPGQTLVGPMQALERESVKWITTMPDVRNTKSRIAFTVVSVEVEGIVVQWKCKALSDVSDMTEAELQNHTQPKSYVTGDDLKRLHRLNIFESCMLQINDQSYLTIEEGDVTAATKKTSWRRECGQLCGKFVDGNRRPPNKPQTDVPSNNNAATVLKVPTVSVTEASGGTVASPATVTNTSDSGEAAGGETGTMDECSDGWITEEELDGEEGLRADCGGGALMGSMDSVTTGSSCCSSPTPRSSPKRSPLLKNQMKRLQMRRQHRKPFDVAQKIGEEVVTETRVVYSTATVVWQDGSIEENISSRQLYPIHHLDEHEFFPGDFVLSGQDASYRDYGVIQRVDHVGRTAVVKWFSTYTTVGQPTPTFFNETEVSVYDLKDHPDFQYRPGTIVIRVANFTGEDATCTAGQVVDNYAEGRVKVWWVDGHYSMCWPQDLFEVGNYDSDHNYWTSGDDEEDSDNGSWETDSAHSAAAAGDEVAGASPLDSTLKPIYIESLERSLLAMENLQQMFCGNPRLENVGAMGKLLDVYKKCRYVDRLLETSHFHEDRFLGLIERVRRTAAATPTATAAASAAATPSVPVTPTAISRAIDHKKRLFGERPCGPPAVAITSPPAQHPLKMPPISPSASMQMKTGGKQRLYKIVRPEVCVEAVANDDDGDDDAAAAADMDDAVLLNDSGPFTRRGTAPTDVQQPTAPITSSSPLPCAIGAASSGRLDQLNIELANQSQQHSLTTTSGNDSGIQTKSSEWGEASAEASSSCSSSKPGDDNTTNSCCSIEEAPSVGGRGMMVDDGTAGDSERGAASEAGAAGCAACADDAEELSEYACARLCTLLKKQMRVALRDLSDRHFKRKFVTEAKAQSPGDDGAIEAKPSALLPAAADAAEPEAASTPATTTPAAVGHTAPPPSAVVPSLVQSPDCFAVDDSAPPTHHYAPAVFQPTNAAQFYRTVAFDHTLLQSSLPLGVWVRAYEDRMDLMSVMIAGPAHTPYEDGMFLFDVQLSKEYPRTPPLFHYISFCSDRLNPNLYEDGKVCVSLLGTWSGKGSEVWGPGSTLLQVIVSIQGLILVAEPYFNEAGYEKQKGSQQGIENSRMYNEMVVIKLVQSMTKLVQQPGGTFRDQIVRHFGERGRPMYERLCGWLEADCGEANADDRPQFPLVPASRGFCLTMAGLLQVFRTKVEALGAANDCRS